MQEESKKDISNKLNTFALTRAMVIFLLGMFIAPLWSSTPGAVDIKEFSGIIILDEGRKKPLDSYARGILLQLSGKSRYEKKSAIEWMATLWFTPDSTQNDKVFMVNDMEAIEALGLTLETARKFSYSDLKPGINKLWDLADEINNIEAKDRSIVEKELFNLAQRLSTYIKMANAFQFAVPYKLFSFRNDSLTQLLGLQNKKAPYSFFDVFKNFRAVGKYMAQAQKDSLVKNSLLDEANILSSTLSQWIKYYQDSPFEVIPVSLGDNEVWYSPWRMLSTAEIMTHMQEMELLNTLCQSYLTSDNQAFTAASKDYRNLVAKKLDGHFNVGKVSAELIYNKADPFMWAKLGYGLCLVLALATLVMRKKYLYWAALIAISLALTYHTFGMIIRMYIMGRPPVTNLFETFVFVGWMSAVLGFVVERFNRTGLGFIIAAVSGLAMLMISQKYALEGDTMGMLVAVLDSNFWLATHVITISMGYAGCCAAGVAGHVYLIQELMGADKQKITDTSKMIYGMLAFGLIFSFVGTVLGGIWADQSWGRFWGWDPKENGALLIIIWCSVVFHARIDGLIRNLGVAVGSVIGIIVVMFAWFGVNLLGVGLHSYGFSSGIAFKLITYVVIESLFLIFMTGLILQKRKLLAK